MQPDLSDPLERADYLARRAAEERAEVARLWEWAREDSPSGQKAAWWFVRKYKYELAERCAQDIAARAAEAATALFWHDVGQALLKAITYPWRCLWRGSVGALLRLVPR